MKKILCILFFLGLILVINGGENLVENSTFDQDVSGWSGNRLVPGKDGKPKREAAPEFVSFCATDGVGDKKGCLKVNFTKVNKHCISWQSGAYLKLKKSVPKNTEAIITFYAKSINGSRRLSVVRPCGGGGAGPAMMSDKWQKFTLRFKTNWSTPGFYFVITDHYGRKRGLEAGAFLLDNIEIKINKT